MLRLIDLREDRDLKQRDLADLLKIDRAQYSKLELGTNKISSDKLIILAKFYNTSIDYILGLTNETKPFKRNSEIQNNNLKKLRIKKELKSEEIGKIINKSQPQYSAIENGRCRLFYDKLIILADYYNTSVDYILGLTNENTPYHKPEFEIK